MAINYLSLTGLVQYDSLIKAFIEEKVSDGVANSFKYVNLVGDELRFYTINPISEDTVADFVVKLPETDVSNLMQLVENAVNGNIAIFGDGGQVVDSGISAENIAMKSEVEAAKADVQASVDELADLVGELPEGTSATSVVDYVNIKTAGIATDTALEELNNQVSGLQTAVQAIQADYLVEEDKTELATSISNVDAKADENAEAIKAISDDYLKAADKTALQEQIDANESAIELLTNGVDSETIDGVNDLIAYVNEHGTEVTTMQGNIADNTAAIEEEKEARESADTTLSGRLDTLEAIDHEAYKAADAELEAAIELKADASVVTALDAAYKAADEAMAADIAELKAVEHQEISEEQINALFESAE